MSAELIMSKWTGIESNQIKSPFNTIDLTTNCPFGISKQKKASRFHSVYPKYIQVYPHLAVMFGLSEKKKPIIAFTLSDHESIMRFLVSMYICGTCILSILGLFRVFVLKIRLLCLEVCSPLFWHYMCCNFRA